jgi:hypothetical protein
MTGLLMHNRVVLAAVTIALSFACCTMAQTDPLPPNPRLLLNQAEIQELKTKVAGPFAEQWAHWLADADKLVAAPIDLPPRGGNWSHNYVCPEHAARLKLGKKIGPWQWEHICPVGNHVLRGDPSNGTLDFDGNAIMDVHLNYAEALVTLGVAYRVTGDPRYALRAKEILLAYAGKYRTYALHGKQLQKDPGTEEGRVSAQPLTEATWLISVTQGADLIWDTLSTEQRAAVASGIMRPALDDVILPANYGIHNMQCRMNSAIGLVGLLLDDKQLIHTAIDDPQAGFRQQIEQGVRDDGMWLEGSNGYHYFTLEGLWPLAEAARHCGIDLYSARYQSMFNAPFALATPDLHLPNFNDSEIVDINAHADLYELAYARWKDAAYLPIIENAKRTSRLALLYGVATLPKAPAATQPSGSHNSAASGYAILCSDVAQGAAWLCLKYGPDGGMHGHQDKNSFVLYADGRFLAADAGTHAYGSPLHYHWDKTSLAHNTLTVDEVSQAPATGKCLAFGSEAGVDYVMADAGPIYPEKAVRFVRTLAMVDDNSIVGIDRVTTDGKEHTFDIAFHLPGVWSDLIAGDTWQAKADSAYKFIEPAIIRPVAAPDTVALTVINHGHPLVLTLLGDGRMPTEVISGTGVGESTVDRIPAAVFRRKANEATYVWAIDLNGRHPQIATIPSPAGTIAVNVGGVIQITVNPAKASVRIRRHVKGS